MSAEDCQSIGNTMEEVANGAVIAREVVGETIHNLVSEKLRMFTDSTNYWNDFLDQVEYPCPVRVQNNHFRR